jgi:hypothetical protein
MEEIAEDTSIGAGPSTPEPKEITSPSPIQHALPSTAYALPSTVYALSSTVYALPITSLSINAHAQSIPGTAQADQTATLQGVILPIAKNLTIKKISKRKRRRLADLHFARTSSISYYVKIHSS